MNPSEKKCKACYARRACALRDLKDAAERNVFYGEIEVDEVPTEWGPHGIRQRVVGESWRPLSPHGAGEEECQKIRKEHRRQARTRKRGKQLRLWEEGAAPEDPKS